jgi:hypothetical protein
MVLLIHLFPAAIQLRHLQAPNCYGRKYKGASPWYGISGYAAAAAVEPGEKFLIT